MAPLIEQYIPVVLYHGFNTDKAAALGSTLSVAGATTLASTLAVTGAATLSSTLAVSGASTVAALTASGAVIAQSTLAVTGASTLSGAVNYKAQVTDTGGAFATPIVLTEAQSGRVLLVDDAAGLDFTLPALAAAQVGTHFKFLVTVTITSNSFRVTAGSGDLLAGGVFIADFDTADTGTYFTPDGSDDLVMTMNGSTTGGKKGTWVEFIATGANQWWVSGGVVFGDGSLATPFS